MEKEEKHMANSRQIILIVDDMENLRKALKLFFRAKGYHVLETENGVAALAVLRNMRVDLVLTDIEMPIMDGLELLFAMRNDQALKSKPVMVMSGNARMRETALASGAQGFVSKPFDLQGLLEMIAGMLAQP